MRIVIVGIALGLTALSSLGAEDGGGTAPTPAPASTPPAAAPAVPAAINSVVLGVIAVADDHKTITIDINGVSTTLSVTPDTVITIDSKIADLTSVSTTTPVRVIYHDKAVVSIDQAKPEKKKKKKK